MGTDEVNKEPGSPDKVTTDEERGTRSDKVTTNEKQGDHSRLHKGDHKVRQGDHSCHTASVSLPEGDKGSVGVSCIQTSGGQAANAHASCQLKGGAAHPMCGCTVTCNSFSAVTQVLCTRLAACRCPQHPCFINPLTSQPPPSPNHHNHHHTHIPGLSLANWLMATTTGTPYLQVLCMCRTRLLQPAFTRSTSGLVYA